MKREYTAPEMKITWYEMENVIITSPGDDITDFTPEDDSFEG